MRWRSFKSPTHSQWSCKRSRQHKNLRLLGGNLCRVRKILYDLASPGHRGNRVDPWGQQSPARMWHCGFHRRKSRFETAFCHGNALDPTLFPAAASFAGDLESRDYNFTDSGSFRLERMRFTIDCIFAGVLHFYLRCASSMITSDAFSLTM